jgi:hypothetical protein
MMLDRALQLANVGLRRTWLVALVAVIACSAFAARAVAALVESAYLEPDPPRQAPLPIVEVKAPVSTPDGAELVTRNMFCSTCTTPAGGLGPTDSFKPDAILIATSIGVDPRATLRVPATEVQGSWGLGDIVPGVGRIERIGFTSIDVVDGARRGTLSLLEIPGGRSDASAATPAPAAADPFADRVRKIDDQTFEVDRTLVRDLVSGAVKAGGVRMLPIEKNGKLDGLRLNGVRPGGVAAALGLRNGDILQAVNNMKIESANTVLDVYSKIDRIDTVALDGLRGGKPLSLTLRLR